MQYLSMKRNLVSVFIICIVGYAGISGAHQTPVVTLESDRRFTGKAFLGCFDNGGGDPDNIEVSIIDMSPPVENLLVSVHIFRGKKLNSITDTVSGDAEPSPSIKLQDPGGDDVYGLLVTKTGIGTRIFKLIYHCNSKSGHTGTDDIGVHQFGVYEPNSE